MTRGYLPEPVWRVLAELSFFFSQLCAKELSRDVCLKLDKAAPLLLYKLEMIFPPSFFLSMQHLILHLPREARLERPVQARWCYPIERCLKLLRKKCRNKAKIEASVVEAFVLEEVSTFTRRGACGVSAGGRLPCTSEGPIPQGAHLVRRHPLRQRAW
jgi:hypothetical protein